METLLGQGIPLDNLEAMGWEPPQNMKKKYSAPKNKNSNTAGINVKEILNEIKNAEKAEKIPSALVGKEKKKKNEKKILKFFSEKIQCLVCKGEPREYIILPSCQVKKKKKNFFMLNFFFFFQTPHIYWVSCATKMVKSGPALATNPGFFGRGRGVKKKKWKKKKKKIFFHSGSKRKRI